MQDIQICEDIDEIKNHDCCCHRSSHSDVHTEKLKKHLENPISFETVAELFKLLSDPSRIRIYWLLCHCEECVLGLSNILGMTSPAISHHLQKLKSSGLITSRREGKEVFYTAAETETALLLHKAIENTMEVSCPEVCFKSEETEMIRQIHDYLLNNLDKRITIEELSQKYPMNSTTMKALFKEVYGESIASHIKKHRLNQAAKLLKSSDLSIAQIACAVGYSSQSKFSESFLKEYHMLPGEYRKEK